MMHARDFTASGVATHRDAGQLLDQFCARFAEHVTITRSEAGARLDTVIGSADIAVSNDRLDIKLRCPTAAMLFTIRSMVAENLFELSTGNALDLNWADGPQPTAIPNFREVSVVDAYDIAPHMRRVVVATDDARHFVEGGMHVRLLIPPKGREPVWPHTEPDGRIHWPKGDDALTIRAYTIRSIDLDRGEMNIDFVVHEGDNVPGATWAMTTRAGDRVGLIGPGGGGVPAARKLILAGDETALPAIARIAASVPANAELRIFLEVADKQEEQPLTSSASMDLTWLHRNGAPAGTTDTLERIIRDLVLAADPETYVWAACEQKQARAIRTFVKTEIARDPGTFSIAAYWQKC
ncbi:siderophore-interacting protein [Rhizobium hainanense]|uniref:NADPH-dependent ferric siderophore reductase, contains FAD-binding and SIP domains n=1 Tax=Rhizobium hainanense TaxID=52131 RepID=A0A1C3VAJ8_9HYPH|nr:siderophore-interacting protein [Rhizobium hainanense]SCB24802.1 NADPH-dependent ferric siderophore reductase, contains FAD-binding and SIP domains [Rhizobium hainanense]